MPDMICSAAEYISDLLTRPQILAVMEYLKEKDGETLSVQKELCAVRSPSNQEEARAELYFSMMSGIGLDEVRMDEVHNVIGLLRGTGGSGLPAAVLAAHMDTVFSADTDCTPVTKEDGMVWAPGIGDDTRGMAEVFIIAKALCALGIRASRDILFVGDAGEEIFFLWEM